MVTVGQQVYGAGGGHGVASSQHRADYRSVGAGKCGKERKREVTGMKQLVFGQVKEHLVWCVAARFENPDLILS